MFPHLLNLELKKGSPMGSVRLKHVTKRFDSNSSVVKDVSLSIDDKEFVVLVGPSGCGKTTTLRMIAGLVEITEGDIYIDERVVNNIPSRDRNIAMVFQNYALYPHMTVFDNLAFGLKLRNCPKAEIQQRVHQAANVLELTDLLDRKPKALSGGQRQRVALGRAIVRQPQVFLFDEPLSNLDANLRVQMRTEISRLHKQLERTMIYVTHDQVEAMSMGDRIVVMKDGTVQQVDVPWAVYNHPANRFVAGFIGSPTMNFFDGRIINDDGVWFEMTGGHFKLPIIPAHHAQVLSHRSAGITVGIRPEHIHMRQLSDSMKAVPVRIEVTAPVGNEILLHFTVGGSSQQHISRIPSDIQPERETLTQLYFDTSKLYFFDKISGAGL